MRAGLQTPGEWATAPGTHTCKSSSSQGMAASAPGVCCNLTKICPDCCMNNINNFNISNTNNNIFNINNINNNQTILSMPNASQ